MIENEEYEEEVVEEEVVEEVVDNEEEEVEEEVVEEEYEEEEVVEEEPATPEIKEEPAPEEKAPTAPRRPTEEDDEGNTYEWQKPEWTSKSNLKTSDVGGKAKAGQKLEKEVTHVSYEF